MKTPVQLGLFSYLPAPPAIPVEPAPDVAPEHMEDAALIAALPDASRRRAPALAAEAAQRRLGGAVPALAALCRHFVAWEAKDEIAEQIAALKALAAIGGPEASLAVARLIATGVFDGPNLAAAVVAATALRVRFDPEAALRLLGHADSAVRAPACECARMSGEVAARLLELLKDLDEDVSTAAACALGRAGRVEARDPLKRSLLAKPSVRVIEALAAVADEEAVVLLARLGRKRPDLADAILSGLDEIDHPKAAVAAAGLRAWIAKAGC